MVKASGGGTKFIFPSFSSIEILLFSFRKAISAFKGISFFSLIIAEYFALRHIVKLAVKRIADQLKPYIK